MPALTPPHHTQQITWGYCLPACAQMALEQFGITAPQSQIAQVLGARAGVGTPFPNIARLTRWNLEVRLNRWVTIDALNIALKHNQAVIVPLTTTAAMPGWGNLRTRHAVLVTHIETNQITYHDPALAYGPVSVWLPEFLLAWNEMEEQAAYLSQT